jgi:hypothetical protein
VKFSSTALVALAVVLGGCTTLADARQGRGTGEKRVYASSYDATWNAVLCSIKGTGLDIVGDNRSEEYILAQRGVTFFSYGENVAVFVRRIAADQTEVEVVSKRSLQTNILAPNWSGEVLNGVQRCLT